jgi:hypothetical protein
MTDDSVEYERKTFSSRCLVAFVLYSYCIAVMY